MQHNILVNEERVSLGRTRTESVKPPRRGSGAARGQRRAEAARPVGLGVRTPGGGRGEAARPAGLGVRFGSGAGRGREAGRFGRAVGEGRRARPRAPVAEGGRLR